VKQFEDDIRDFEDDLLELKSSKLEHETVRKNQMQKKETIDAAIENGPKKNLKKLQEEIVKL
jgi:hypothetical protein